MTRPKYSILEHERRFLVDPAAVPPLAGAGVILIEDLYLAGGRLRLRKMTGAENAAPVFKLGKKYQSDDPLSGPIVNIYLSAPEHELLAGLPGRRLRKRRHRIEPAAPYHIDVFEGALAGLVLSEAETLTIADVRAIAVPPWAVREVTADPFYAGGNLALLEAATLRRRLDAEWARSASLKETTTP